eukprot:scaffold17883_cov32-Attheya_sp.AAC.3
MYPIYADMWMLIVDSVGWDTAITPMFEFKYVVAIGPWVHTDNVPDTGLAFHPSSTEIKPDPPSTTQPSVMPLSRKTQLTFEPKHLDRKKKLN